MPEQRLTPEQLDAQKARFRECLTNRIPGVVLKDYRIPSELAREIEEMNKRRVHPNGGLLLEDVPE